MFKNTWYLFRQNGMEITIILKTENNLESIDSDFKLSEDELQFIQNNVIKLRLPLQEMTKSQGKN